MQNQDNNTTNLDAAAAQDQGTPMGQARPNLVGKSFEVGKTYFTRSIGNSDCILKITIAKRTAKTLTTNAGKTCRIFKVPSLDDHERVMPMGHYSFAPVFTADKIEALPHSTN
jgi:hypothetical protein